MDEALLNAFNDKRTHLMSEQQNSRILNRKGGIVMGEFKGFMNYDKQQLHELSLVDRLKIMTHSSKGLQKTKLHNKVHVVWIVVRHFVRQVNHLAEKRLVVYR